VWFQLLGLKLTTEWQAMQLVDPTGTWPVGLPDTEVPLWQDVQLVDVLKVLWSGLAPPQPAVLWQVSQVVTLAWMVVLGLPTAAWKLPVWQAAHWVETLKFEWNRPLAQLLKLPLWQLSQLADDDADTDANGMWLADLPSAGGNAPVWQLAHCAATAS
jgi:hypothetical protein